MSVCVCVNIVYHDNYNHVSDEYMPHPSEDDCYLEFGL